MCFVLTYLRNAINFDHPTFVGTSAWTEYDTLAMPEALFDRILEYSEREREGWQIEEAEIISEEGEVKMLKAEC